ncbi:tandem-95 repeat protein, partial [Myxococcota bacterium]|nr:tandem-95 repeat protein [Myxococcota bacterium]
MPTSIRALVSALALVLCTVPRPAHAEGTAQLTTNSDMVNDTVLYVDIVDASVERIRWTGSGQINVRNPNGTNLGNFNNNSTITPTAGVNGPYRITLASDQTGAWDISVLNAVAPGGRLHSYNWSFDTGTFSGGSSAMNTSFFVLAEAGGPTTTSVLEMRFDGLQGFIFDIAANGIGVNGANAGRSVPSAGNSVTPEHALYLNPPTLATYTAVTPVITGFGFAAVGQPTACAVLDPGATTGVFTFDTNVVGTYHVQCDLDGNGVFDLTSPNDLDLVGTTVVGANVVTWDGTTAGGGFVANGVYDCRVIVNVAEVHFVAEDMETSYPGLRFFELDASATRSSLAMYWEDALVQGNEVTMPNGQQGIVAPGANGMSSGAYADAAVANTNARAWGNFSSTSKGNNALLDTFSWADGSVTTTIEVTALDAATDSDLDGLTDLSELCTHGTDPGLFDTDGDGIGDGVEVADGATFGTNVDGDGLTNPLDTDSDGDGVIDGVDGQGDLDGDGVPSYLDPFEVTAQAVADTASVNEDQSVTTNVLANDTGLTNGPIVVTIEAAPANGTATVNVDGTITYVPRANYNGADAYTYRITDALGHTSTAVVSVTVVSVNDVPRATPNTVTVPEDGTVTTNVLANDNGLGDAPLVVTVVTAPANGTATVNANNTITFVPAPDFNGTTTYEYRVTDANGDTSTALVTVNVTPVNDLPAAAADTITVAEDGSVTSNVLANDTGLGDRPLTVVITAQSPNGTATVNADGTVTFVPAPDFRGAASYTYQVTDANGDTSSATVSVNVTNVNDVPAANADTVTVAEDGTVTSSVLANDAGLGDGPVTVVITAQSPNGTATVNADGTITFVPAPDFVGAASYSYRVTDADGQSSTATVSVTVTSVDDVPAASADVVTVAEDGSVTSNVLANDAGLGDGPVNVSITAQPANGTATVNADGTITFVPSPDFVGTVSYTYQVTDADGQSSTATVTVNVTNVDDVPVAFDDAATITEDGSSAIDVLSNDTGLGDGPVLVSVSAPSPDGVAVVNPDGTVTFTPLPDFSGTTTFTYEAVDADGQVTSGVVTVSVTPVNDDPVAGADRATVAPGQSVTIDVLANDGDVDGDPLTVTSVTQPSSGSVAIDASGTVTYTAAPGFTGTVTFTYTASDDAGGTVTGTVTIDVGDVDSDGDGLLDGDEVAAGTDPNDADSDDDGLADGAEPSWNVDTDGDGLVNGVDPDSDDDGLFDGTEAGVTIAGTDTDVGAGFFVPDADPSTTTSPVDADTDDGSALDGAEDVNHDGRVDVGERDPNDPADDVVVPVDTDGDGLPDAEETAIGTSPTDADTDDDGVADGAEPNYAADMDGDGLIGALDPDADDDGLYDGTELGLTTPLVGTDLAAGNFVPDADPSTTTSPVDADSDDGGVADGA